LARDTAKDLERLARAIGRIQLDVDPQVFDPQPDAPRATIVLDDRGLPTIPEWGECPTFFAPPWDFDTCCTVSMAHFLAERSGDW
jgi:hypothetical protein